MRAMREADASSSKSDAAPEQACTRYFAKQSAFAGKVREEMEREVVFGQPCKKAAAKQGSVEVKEARQVGMYTREREERRCPCLSPSPPRRSTGTE